MNKLWYTTYCVISMTPDTHYNLLHVTCNIVQVICIIYSLQYYVMLHVTCIVWATKAVTHGKHLRNYWNIRILCFFVSTKINNWYQWTAYGRLPQKSDVKATSCQEGQFSYQIFKKKYGKRQSLLYWTSLWYMLWWQINTHED